MFAELDEKGRFVGMTGVFPMPSQAPGRDHAVPGGTLPERGGARRVAAELSDAAIASTRQEGATLESPRPSAGATNPQTPSTDVAASRATMRGNPLLLDRSATRVARWYEG